MPYSTDTAFYDVARVEIDLEDCKRDRDWLSIALYGADGEKLADLNIYSPTGSRLTVETKLTESV